MTSKLSISENFSDGTTKQLTQLDIFKERYKEVGHYFYRTLNVNAYEYSEFMYSAFGRYCELGIPWYDYKDCVEYIKTYNQYKLECDNYVAYRPNPLANLLVIYSEDLDPKKKIILEIHPIEAIKITLPKIQGYTAKEVYACLSYIFMLDKRMTVLKDKHALKPLTAFMEFYSYEKVFNSPKVKDLWGIDEIEHDVKNVDDLCFLTSKDLIRENGTKETTPIFYWNLVKNELDNKITPVTNADVDWSSVMISLASDTLQGVDFDKTPGGFKHEAIKRTLSNKFEEKFDRYRQSQVNQEEIKSYYDASKDLRKNNKGVKSFYNLTNYNAPLGDTAGSKSGIDLRSKPVSNTQNFTVFDNTNKAKILDEELPVQKKAVKLNWKEPRNDKRTYNNIINVLTSKKEDRE